LRLARGAHESDLLVSVTRLAGSATLGGDLSAAVFLCDPARRYEGDVEVLQRYFGLTSAEARVMQTVGTGHPPREAAALLGISYGTVRTHLKSVYRKANVSTQAELVRVFHSLDLPGDT
jgi:DNA-binding CsgD family transcriptional regulator